VSPFAARVQRHASALHRAAFAVTALGLAAIALSGCAAQRLAAQASPAPKPAAPQLVSGTFVQIPNDFVVMIPASDVETVNDVHVSDFRLGTSFDSDNKAAGKDYFQGDLLTFSFFASVSQDDNGHKVSISVNAPSPAQSTFTDAPTLSVGRGGSAKYTIQKPSGGWPTGDWTIDVLVDGSTAKTFPFSAVSAGGSSPALGASQDALGLSSEEQVWHIDGYRPEKYLYITQVLGAPVDYPPSRASDAYISDDGTKVFTSFPAALDASDGSVLWEGKPFDSGTLALGGDGIYQLLDTNSNELSPGSLTAPVRRIWPNPKGFSTARAAMSLSAAHGYPSAGPPADASILSGVRDSTWEVAPLRSDATKRYQQFYERHDTPKAGSREMEHGPWEWMLFDAKAKKVVFTRGAADLLAGTKGAQGLGVADSPPSSDDPGLWVFSDGRAIIGNKLVGADSSQDRDVLGSTDGVVTGIAPVEGRPSMVLVQVKLAADGSSGSQESQSNILYDVVMDKRFAAPDGVVGASRDGLLVLCGDGSQAQGGLGLTLWKLTP
jgi:hypothetical protein